MRLDSWFNQVTSQNSSTPQKPPPVEEQRCPQMPTVPTKCSCFHQSSVGDCQKRFHETYSVGGFEAGFCYRLRAGWLHTYQPDLGWQSYAACGAAPWTYGAVACTPSLLFSVLPALYVFVPSLACVYPPSPFGGDPQLLVAVVACHARSVAFVLTSDEWAVGCEFFVAPAAVSFDLLLFFFHVPSFASLAALWRSSTGSIFPSVLSWVCFPLLWVAVYALYDFF